MGYVGLPLLVGLARHFDAVTGLDIDRRRIASLKAGEDWTGEIESGAPKSVKARLTDKAEELGDATFRIVTVLTPIDQAKRPDLRPLMGACETIGEVLHRRHNKPGNGHGTPLIVFEPGVENI